jgi:hypothetical protein
MTSVLNVDTIADKAGTGPVGLTKQSAAKGWVSLNGTGTAAIRDSFNTSSITDNATGTYTQTFTNAMSNASFAGATHVIVTTNGDCSATGEATAPTTTTFRVGCRSLANVLVDPQYAMINTHGDLA